MPNTSLALVFGLALGVWGASAWAQSVQAPVPPGGPASAACPPNAPEADWPPAGSAPTDVIATLGGQEITRRDLQAEIGQATFSDFEARKRAEARALLIILERRILADAARRQGLDKTPGFATGKRPPSDAALVQALRRQVLADAPPPTQAEIKAFIAANPYRFAEHKVFPVDQIRLFHRPPVSELKRLQPLKTMDEIEVQLKKDNISYLHWQATIDVNVDNMDQRLVAFILQLPKGEVFVLPDKDGDGLLVNVVRETRTIPLTGQVALRYASSLVAQQHAEEAELRASRDILKQWADTSAHTPDELTIRKDYDCAWSGYLPLLATDRATFLAPWTPLG